MVTKIAKLPTYLKYVCIPEITEEFEISTIARI